MISKAMVLVDEVFTYSSAPRCMGPQSIINSVMGRRPINVRPFLEYDNEAVFETAKQGGFRGSPLRQLLRAEAAISRKYWACFAAHWIIYVYWAETVFRNLAFTRVERAVRDGYMQPTRLLDLGHEWTSSPGWQHFGELFAERPINLLSLYVLLLPAFSHLVGASRPIHMCRLLARYSLVMSAGHAFRFVCYMSTTLPGSADHCVASSREEFMHVHAARVWHGADIYLRNPVYPGNCGDLCFSGHMLLLTFVCKVAATGSAQLAPSRPNVRMGARLFFAAAFVVQVLGTISKRNHYTVDVVLGIFVAHVLDEKVCFARACVIPPPARPFLHLVIGLVPHSTTPPLCRVAGGAVALFLVVRADPIRAQRLAGAWPVAAHPYWRPCCLRCTTFFLRHIDSYNTVCLHIQVRLGSILLTIRSVWVVSDMDRGCWRGDVL